jgi:hypothetical protein
MPKQRSRKDPPFNLKLMPLNVSEITILCQSDINLHFMFLKASAFVNMSSPQYLIA